MKITEHAEKRGKERLNLCKKKLRKQAFLALKDGLTVENICCKLRKYLIGLYKRQKRKGKHIHVYEGAVYIFLEATLLTVLTVPTSIENYEQYIRI